MNSLSVSRQENSLGPSYFSIASHSLPDIRSSLKTRGWAEMPHNRNLVASLPDVLMEIGNALGIPFAPRGRVLVQSLTPTAASEARAASMSAKFGVGQQPWHIDLAHWPVPARYILLGCESPGVSSTATELTRCSELFRASVDINAAHTQPYLVRNGRESFYSTLLDKRRPFARIDPGCMEPRSDAARKLQTRIQSFRPECTVEIRWKPGAILIVDNWKVAHRRLDATHASDRRLLRVSVMERA
jgi:alpha-ketoglutarate-dependent taurine dioxygenase